MVNTWPAASSLAAASTIPSTRLSTYTGLRTPRPIAGRMKRRRAISSTGRIVHGREPGPYTSPGRMIVHATSPAACAGSTTCSLATLVSTYGTPLGRIGWLR